MARIRYVPVYPIGEVTHLLSETVWNPGDERDIPDDWKIRVRTAGVSHYVSVVDDLLGSPDYVLAQTNLNPNYTCIRCGAQTHTEAALVGPKLVVYDVEGQRACPNCYHTLKEQAMQCKTETAATIDTSKDY